MYSFFKRVVYTILIFNTLLYSGQSAQHSDSIFYNSNQILTGKINSIFDKSVVIEIKDKNTAIALFTIDSIFCSGLGKIYSRETGYYSKPDSINKYLFFRDKNPDQLWKEKPAQPKHSVPDSTVYQIGPRYEFTISAGAVTPTQIGDALDGITSVLVSFGDLEVKEGSQNQLQLGFNYLSETPWAYGVHIIYEKYTHHYYYQKEKTGSVKSQYFIVAFNVSYYWLKLDWMQYYSGLGVGFLSASKSPTGSVGVESENTTTPTFNLNFIGIKIGYRLYIELELGLGYRGLFNIGLACQI